MFQEKSYKRSGYEACECPKCYGKGSDSMSIFSKNECSKCEGTGVIMWESSREVEATNHKQSDNNEYKNKWLFS